MNAGGPVRLLLVEVMVGEDRYCIEADTDRVWLVSDPDQPTMESLQAPPQVLLQCLRAEVLRRHLDTAVDEADLAALANAYWSESFVEVRVRSLCMARSASDYTGGAAERIPLEALREHVQGETVPVDDDWVPPRWCDVESVPPRTLDFDDEPVLTVLPERIELTLAAYGPPERRPAEETVIATMWDTERNESLMRIPLHYRREGHLFHGSGPRRDRDEEFAAWREAPSLQLDIASVSQGVLLPRDEDHLQAWRRWRAWNAVRTDTTRVRSLKSLSMEHQHPRASPSFDIIDSDNTSLPIVGVRDGMGTASIHPAVASREVDPALRRLAICTFYDHVAGDPERKPTAWRAALDIDFAIALLDAGDPRSARALADNSWQWLYQEAQALLDAGDSYYTSRIAVACGVTCGLLGPADGSRLQKISARLTPSADVWPDIEQTLRKEHSRKTAITAGHERRRFQTAMARWWVDLRAQFAAVTWGLTMTYPTAPPPPKGAPHALMADYKYCLGYADVLREALENDGADRPLLAELRRARPL